MIDKFRLVIEYPMRANYAYFNTREEAEYAQKLIREAINKSGRYNRDEEQIVSFKAKRGTMFDVVIKNIVSTIVEDLESMEADNIELNFEKARKSKEMEEKAEKEGLAKYLRFSSSLTG